MLRTHIRNNAGGSPTPSQSAGTHLLRFLLLLFTRVSSYHVFPVKALARIVGHRS